jgi:cell wall-associated NlpC family hydrolase
MRPFRTNALRRSRATVLCAALLILFALPDAQARTAKHRKRTAFSVALQPFSLVHSAIQTVAVPVAQKAPRILRAVATAPIRAVAARTGRGDNYEEDEADSAAQPIRVAYQSARRMPERGPRAESADDYDQDQDREQEDEDANPQIERRGDRPMVEGKRAVLRNGIAYAPSRAPQNVKNAIWAANTLRRKPYVWGGGHGSFSDHGYDCSGSVSYALHGAGVLAAPLPSSDLMRYGERGRGRWITVYARSGHTFAVIAGLRLDTTDLGRGGDVGPRWYVDGRDTRGFVARHPAGF